MSGPSHAATHGKARFPGIGLRTVRTIIALMLREISTTYGRSAGGYIWVFVEPLAGIALLSLVFSQVFHRPALGHNFPLFYATGLLPFIMYNNIANKVATSLRFSRPLLAYPAVTVIDVVLARLLLNGVVELVVFAIVIYGAAAFFMVPLLVDYARVIEGLMLGILLGAGVGSVNCYMFMRFPTWERTWGILNRPLVLMSCVFFLFEGAPASIRDLLWWNPLVHVNGIVRSGVYVTYEANYASALYVAALGGGLLVIGLMVLHLTYRDLLEL